MKPAAFLRQDEANVKLHRQLSEGEHMKPATCTKAAAGGGTQTAPGRISNSALEVQKQSCGEPEMHQARAVIQSLRVCHSSINPLLYNNEVTA